MKLRIKESGFSTVIVVTTLLGLTAVGCAGWYVLSANKKTTSSTQPAPAPSSSKEVTQPPAHTDPSENGTYLVIEEWGVRFPVPSSIKGDIKYGLKTQNGSQAAYFEVGKFAALPGSSCKLVTESDGSGLSGGLGVVTYRQSHEATASDSGFGFPVVASTGGNWYYTSPPKGGCTNNEEFGQQESDAGQALAAALDKLEVLPQ